MKKNFLYNFLLTSSNLLFPLLTFPYLSRILGADGIGICNFILSYGQNYTIVAALGIPVYGIREIAKVGDDKEKRSILFFELLSIHIILTLFFLLLYFASIFFYADLREYKELAILGSSLILFNVFSIEWLFAGISNFKYITIRSLIIRFLSVIAIFLVVRSREDFYIYFVIIVLTSLVTVSMDVYYARKFISRRVTLTMKGALSHLKAVTLLGAYMVFTNIYSVLPTTLLGFLSTKSAVGYYFGANRIIRMVISIFSALTIVLIPRLNIAVEQHKSQEYLSLINKSLNIVISFGIPATAFIFLLANPLVMLLAGGDFLNSVLVIKIMAPIILSVAFAQVFVLLILSANRKDKQMVMLSIMGMVISLSINVIFIPYYAEISTGFSQLVSEIIVTFLAFIFAKKVLDFQFPTKSFLLNLLCVIPFALVAYLSMWLFDDNFLILLSSAFLCSLYFLIYQIYLIKNSFVMEAVSPIFKRFNIVHK